VRAVKSASVRVDVVAPGPTNGDDPMGYTDKDRQKDVQKARWNLIGGAFLLPLCLVMDYVGLTRYHAVSLLWLGLTVVCVVYMVGSWRYLTAARAKAATPAGPTYHSNFS
jgi:hypothetical protein